MLQSTGRALERGLVRGPERAEAVVGVVEVDLGFVGGHAGRGLGLEEVGREAEVDEHGELARRWPRARRR